MTDKKITTIRLVIYCFLSFVPFWIILPIMNNHFGETVYTCEVAQAATYALGVFGMLIPSIAHIITRLVTKEGFKNTYLSINFKGNAKWYLASIGIKVLEGIIGALLIWRVFAGDLSFKSAFSLETPKTLIGMILLQLAFSIIVFFPAFGEEWGWRGYMMPKLIKLLGKPAAILVGGIIWGLWHAPLTIAGHNFGTDYFGYPFIGIALMCLMCVLFNAFLTLLTEKTGSVYPASFSHIINNNINAPLLIAIAGSSALTKAVEGTSAVSVFLITSLPLLLITGVLSYYLIQRKG